MAEKLELFHGQCQCGAVVYRVAGESLALFACHCAECQKQSSSAFGMALWVRPRSVQLSGQLQTWMRPTPSGKQMRCSFCPTCGTRVFHQMTDTEAILSIKPGTLDDTSGLRPVAHIWSRSAQPWLDLDALSARRGTGSFGCLVYPENPESFEPIFESWRLAKQSGR